MTVDELEKKVRKEQRKKAKRQRKNRRLLWTFLGLLLLACGLAVALVKLAGEERGDRPEAQTFAPSSEPADGVNARIDVIDVGQGSAMLIVSGGEAMLETLRAFDPARASKLGAGDKRRIVRAVEIYRLTGKTATEHDEETRRRPPRYDAARIVLNYKNRADLYARIDQRVTRMAADGLFDEVRRLLDAGLSPDCTAMQAIGYKEAVLALRGELTREEALDLIRQGSRRYAKRQITWFHRWQDAHRVLWERVPDFEAALRSSTAFLQSRGYHE